MADGTKDLKEKNVWKPDSGIPKSKFTSWKNFQGREDAEMLQEKSFGWRADDEGSGSYGAPCYED